nr:MAG TPA: Single-strand binding protein family [Caudoviricetes sp.]
MGIWVSKENSDHTRYMRVWGKLSREPHIGQTQKGEPKVQFGMTYAKNEFMNIIAVGNNDTTKIACALEKGDVVSIEGTWSQRKYTTREGEEKVWSELRADVITPQSLLAAVLDLLASPHTASASGVQNMQNSECEANAPDSEDEGVLPWEQQEEEPESDYVPRI